MYFEFDDAEPEDFGTLRVTPSLDDHFFVGGYGREPKIEFALYAHEARELIELLQPLAAREEVEA